MPSSDEYLKYKKDFDDSKFGAVADEKADFCINLDEFFPKLKEDESLIFLSHGCAGTASGRKNKMAEYIIKDESFLFNILLGDNVYDSGIQSKNVMVELRDNFFETYKYEKPHFCILGNHDYNFWSHQGKKAKGKPVALRQVDATYMFERLNWLMPYRYYALYSVIFQVVFFMLDSNTLFLGDDPEHDNGQEDKDQRDWFTNVYTHFSEENFPTRILVMHHPLVAIGKPEDKIYLYTGCADHKYKTPIGDLITKALKKIRLDIKFDLHLCAHDHFAYVCELNETVFNAGLLQCISGSVGKDRETIPGTGWGGGALEPNADTEESRDVKCSQQFNKENQNLSYKNAVVKVEISRKGKIYLQFIEVSTEKTLCAFNFSREQGWLVAKSIDPIQLMAEEGNNRTQFIDNLTKKKSGSLRDIHKLVAFISCDEELRVLGDVQNTSLRKRRENFSLLQASLLELRNKLMDSYLAVETSKLSSDYRTYVYDMDKNKDTIRPCSKEWRDLEYLISSKILYGVKNLPKDEALAFCEDVCEKKGSYKFVSVARTVSQLGRVFTDIEAKNKTYLAFKEHIENGEVVDAEMVAMAEWEKMISNLKLNPADFPINGFEIPVDLYD